MCAAPKIRSGFHQYCKGTSLPMVSAHLLMPHICHQLRKNTVPSRENNQQFIPFFISGVQILILSQVSGQSKKFIILSFISCYVEYWEGLGGRSGRWPREIYNKFWEHRQDRPRLRLEKNLEELRYGKTIVIINTYLIVVDFLKHLTDIRATCHASA